ncbi:bifunctional [glutamine synthetase] adenylyltransferase/[glutamine synthetase]-adenylyl-L-tyrosine phosphorylase [Rhodobacteraceae bacterium XHP0102]|nr:bifunctional [glutamine synthetase] adenylyltransferase/[glutamine synthetase]-adenylyl-L-tyrosine phosphorylase [Rhodobacteraceae bacterium XHP0102]
MICAKKDAIDKMPAAPLPLAARLTRAPIPYERDLAASLLAELPQLADQPPEMRELLFGVAGCAPYLAGLISREADWLAMALCDSPEAGMAALLADAAGLGASDLDRGLRRLKRRAAILSALADCGGAWDVLTLTAHWTRFADACVQSALRVHVGAEARRGRIPGQTEEDAMRDGAGMVALAMGKMGAFELNYSSDIDLICLFDETRFDAGDEMEARTGFVRATRRMTASLAEISADGYVFRTDLRLRPDASVTPVCISMAAAERYYEAEGRNWERAAYIKARAAAGDIAAGARFLKTLTPFVWRKHLDFAAIRDTQDMRQRIRDHKGLHGMTLEGHNLKLGAGGIREVEFFAQTRQLVAGGRDPDLRVNRTVDGLAALAQKNWITAEVADSLSAHYLEHREIEHRLQMMNDAQTHSLPKSPDGFARLAAFMGMTDVAAFRARLSARLHAVDAACEPFYTPQGAPEAAVDTVTLSDAQAEILARWPGYACLRASRGRELFEQIKPTLLAKLMTSAMPDEALSNFDSFLRGLPAGVQLFSLFQSNPSLIDLLADICATAPALSRYLSRNAQVLDAVLSGGFFAAWPDRTMLHQGLRAALDGLDYEGQLNAARRWLKEWHFRVGVHHLRGLIDAEEAAKQYTDLADTVVACFWPMVCAELARKHGPAPGRGGIVLAMGSLGAARLTAGSDLDLIVIYDAEGVEMTEGPRPLDARGWFSKATKMLITALSAPTSEGRLYEVDMRLRPSGRQGPVATSLEAFTHYQMNEAWGWEHMALTRARVVAGDATLAADVEATRMAVIQKPRAAHQVIRELADMRQRLAAAGRTGSTFDVKAGAGGMQDIDLIGQAGALIAATPARATRRHLRAAAQNGWLTHAEAEVLQAAHMLFSQVAQAARLLTDAPLDPSDIGQGGLDFLMRATGHEDRARLEAALDAGRAQSVAIIEAALARAP